MNTRIYNNLFAYRTQLLDDQIINESIIINRLKQNLLVEGVAADQINEYIYNFYMLYNIQMNEMQVISFNSPYNQVTMLMEGELIQNEPYLGTIIFDQEPAMFTRLLRSNVYNFNTVPEDVIITTDENSLTKMQILNISKDAQERCTICMDNMKEGDEYYNLTCSHVFHVSCIKEYLLNYNNHCPLCKNEIGDKKINI